MNVQNPGYKFYVLLCAGFLSCAILFIPLLSLLIFTRIIDFIDGLLHPGWSSENLLKWSILNPIKHYYFWKEFHQEAVARWKTFKQTEKGN